MCTVTKCSVCRLKQYEAGVFTDGLTLKELLRLKDAVEGILNLGLRDEKFVRLHSEVKERITELCGGMVVLN